MVAVRRIGFAIFGNFYPCFVAEQIDERWNRALGRYSAVPKPIRCFSSLLRFFCMKLGDVPANTLIGGMNGNHLFSTDKTTEQHDTA
jgi:hypothetical protein